MTSTVPDRNETNGRLPLATTPWPGSGALGPQSAGEDRLVNPAATESNSFFRTFLSDDIIDVSTGAHSLTGGF